MYPVGISTLILLSDVLFSGLLRDPFNNTHKHCVTVLQMSHQ